MRAGPKRAAILEPLDLRDLPKQRGPRTCALIEKFVRVPTGKGARRRAKLRPWQRELILGSLRPRVRSALWSMARGNGKTTAAAMLATAALFSGEEGAQVLCLASDERQARQVFNKARRMVELNPALLDRVQVHSDRILYPATDSVLAPLPAEPAALQGWDPYLAIVDELHVVRDEVWEAMTLAAGKRQRSLVLGISTSPESKDSVMFRLVEYGRTAGDPSFYFREFVTPDHMEVDDEDGWAWSNPALDDFLARDALRANLRQTREPVFRRFRLNQMVGTVGSWLPWGAWDECADPGRVVDPDEPVVLGFDGSLADDSTALIGCTVAAPHHVFAVRVWQKDEPGWRVPREEVGAAVARAFGDLNVVELAADPYLWIDQLQAWQRRHGDRVVEWPTNAVQRMAPATDRLRAEVLERGVTHDGSEVLASHVANAVVKNTAHGDVVVKDRKGSPRKIDACVAAIVAHDRAAWHAANPPRRKRMLVVA